MVQARQGPAWLCAGGRRRAGSAGNQLPGLAALGKRPCSTSIGVEQPWAGGDSLGKFVAWWGACRSAPAGPQVVHLSGCFKPGSPKAGSKRVGGQDQPLGTSGDPDHCPPLPSSLYRVSRVVPEAFFLSQDPPKFRTFTVLSPYQHWLSPLAGALPPMEEAFCGAQVPERPSVREIRGRQALNLADWAGLSSPAGLGRRLCDPSWHQNW